MCCAILLNRRLTVCVRWSRLRVKDINDAIKELGQMIAGHTGSSQPMTRLMIVQEAVTVITALEQQLRGTTGPPRSGLSRTLHGQELEQEDTKRMTLLCLVQFLHVHDDLLSAEAI